MSPPTFDILNIQIWKVKMSMYLKALGIHVYLATIKDSYINDSKYIEANAKALHVLKSTLNDDYLSRVSNIDSAFVVWNTLTSLGEKDLYYAGSDSDVGSDTSNKCYMVQGDNPLEVTTESEVDDNDMSYDELSTFCKLLLEKYDMMKKENKNLKKKFDCMLNENDSFRTKVACLEKEKEDLKNENVSLFSKLSDLCEANNILKNKIDLVEKQKETVLQENNSLKRKFVEKEKDFVSQKKKKNDFISHHALHATTSEINVLKNKMNDLSSTLSSCAFNHSRLESMFSKKQTPNIHAHHNHAFAYVAQHDHKHSHKHPKVYTCTHCGRKGHLAKFCYDKLHHFNFVNNKNFWVPYKTNPKGPKKIWVPKSPPCVFDVGEGSLKT